MDDLSEEMFLSFNFVICLANLSASKSILAYIDCAASSTRITAVFVLQITSAICLPSADGFLITDKTTSIP